MPANDVPLEVLEGLWANESTRVDGAHAPLAARLHAKLRAGRLDRDVELGKTAAAGSALAVHMARLTSIAEREQLARTLWRTLNDAHGRRPGLSLRAPLHRARIAAVEDVIDDVTLRLHAPRPVRARGMARLRMLLADGAGPLYGPGCGSLAAELRGVLAAL
jgi:hypothetical protein